MPMYTQGTITPGMLSSTWRSILPWRPATHAFFSGLEQKAPLNAGLTQNMTLGITWGTRCIAAGTSLNATSCRTLHCEMH